VTTLQLTVKLSILCVAAFDAGDHKEASRLMRERDALYLELDWFDARVFRAWPNMTKAQLDALLATGSPS
jgi:hypothetical protein